MGDSTPEERAGKLTDPATLDKIDQLFACNIGNYIDLPQVIVVGDQSSGKSSVLQGLTDLPFPRDSGLCTKFATHITFRRSEAKHINVKIIPYINASSEHVERVCAWGKSNIPSLDGEIFTKIMQEVGAERIIEFIDRAHAKFHRYTTSWDYLVGSKPFPMMFSQLSCLDQLKNI